MSEDEMHITYGKNSIRIHRDSEDWDNLWQLAKKFLEPTQTGYEDTQTGHDTNTLESKKMQDEPTQTTLTVPDGAGLKEKIQEAIRWLDVLDRKCERHDTNASEYAGYAREELEAALASLETPRITAPNVDVLVEALEKYADRRNWYFYDAGQKDIRIIKADKDLGETARMALEKYRTSTKEHKLMTEAKDE